MPKCTSTFEWCSEVFIYFGGWKKIWCWLVQVKCWKKNQIKYSKFCLLEKIEIRCFRWLKVSTFFPADPYLYQADITWGVSQALQILWKNWKSDAFSLLNGMSKYFLSLSEYKKLYMPWQKKELVLVSNLYWNLFDSLWDFFLFSYVRGMSSANEKVWMLFDFSFNCSKPRKKSD